MEDLIGDVQSSDVQRGTDALDTNSLRSSWRNREWRTIKRDVARKCAPAVRGVPENRPRIGVSLLSRQRSDQKCLELRIPCMGYFIARGFGAPDADDDRRLSPGTVLLPLVLSCGAASTAPEGERARCLV